MRASLDPIDKTIPTAALPAATADWFGWTLALASTIVSSIVTPLVRGAVVGGSGQIALLWPLQTLLIVLLSVLFLNERLSLVQWSGGLLILAGAFLAVERMNTTPWRRRLRALMVTNRT